MTVDQLHLELQHLVNAGHYDWKILDESEREISRVIVDPDAQTVEIVAD